MSEETPQKPETPEQPEEEKPKEEGEEKKEENAKTNKKKRPDNTFQKAAKSPKNTQLPKITPNAKCQLRLLKLERVKDWLTMEKEFMRGCRRISR